MTNKKFFIKEFFREKESASIFMIVTQIDFFSASRDAYLEINGVYCAFTEKCFRLFK